MGVQKGSLPGSDSSPIDKSVSEFDQLLSCHERNVYALACYLTGSAEDAEEVLSSVFLRLWGTREGLNGDSDISLSILRTAMEEISQRLEMRAYAALNASVEKVCDQSKEAEQSLGESLKDSINKLPFEYAKVFVIRDVLGLSIDRVSKILSLPEQDCRARLQRARLMIRRYLQRDRGEVEAQHNISAHEHSAVRPDLLV